jgi:hypothetical protein
MKKSGYSARGTVRTVKSYRFGSARALALVGFVYLLRLPWAFGGSQGRVVGATLWAHG